MNYFSPFQPEREFKVYKSCKCSQIIYAVEYFNTVCSLDYSFQFQFKLLNKLYNELGE